MALCTDIMNEHFETRRSHFFFFFSFFLPRLRETNKFGFVCALEIQTHAHAIIVLVLLVLLVLACVPVLGKQTFSAGGRGCYHIDICPHTHAHTTAET
jgi:hypothetical protein